MFDVFETIAKLAAVHSPAGFETPITSTDRTGNTLRR